MPKNAVKINPRQVKETIAAALGTFKETEPEVFEANQIADVVIIRNPYAILGIVVMMMPFVSFVVITVFGYRTFTIHHVEQV